MDEPPKPSIDAASYLAQGAAAYRWFAKVVADLEADGYVKVGNTVWVKYDEAGREVGQFSI